MEKKRKGWRGKIWLWAFCLLTCMIGLCVAALPALWAQQEDLGVQEDDMQGELIQTEIGLDQMILSEEPVGGKEAVLPQGQKADAELSVEEKQILMINESLKNMIEENKRLIDEKESVEKEIGSLRGQTEIRSNRINALSRQRDDLSRQLQELDAMQSKYETQIKELRNLLDQKEKQFQETLEVTEKEKIQQEKEDLVTIQEILPTLKDKKHTSAEKETQKELRDKTRKTLHKVESTARKAASKITELRQENKRLLEDSAKLHYNLGNTFFEQKKFTQAALEYMRVIELLPFDASAHYNLAFISGEFLQDYETAIEHYQMYLYLEPEADDAYLVKEKILEAKLALKTTIDSIIDTPF
ncbi:MAG: hypothetical protein ABIJ41_03295 [Candidatus Omnitrophota bacterium]